MRAGVNPGLFIMQIKITNDSFISDIWPNPKKGQIRDVTDSVAHHLIGAGVAIQLKIESSSSSKKIEPGSVLPADPASLSATAPRRRGRPRKVLL